MPKKTSEQKSTKETKNSVLASSSANDTPETKTRWRKWLINKWVFIGLAIILIGGGASVYVFWYSKEDTSSDGELSYAEQLETFGMSEEADQDATNTVLLTKATAHYSEGNYDTALERLGSIFEPDPDTKTAVDQLYGDIYEAIGQPEKALEYRKSTLSQQEKGLLDNVEKAPDLHFTLAQLYENAGDTAKAKEHYQLFVDEFDAPPEELTEDAIIQALETSKQKLDSL